MVVRVRTPDSPPARQPAGSVSQARANVSPRAGVTSFSREYMEYWAPLLQHDDQSER